MATPLQLYVGVIVILMISMFIILSFEKHQQELFLEQDRQSQLKIDRNYITPTSPLTNKNIRDLNAEYENSSININANPNSIKFDDDSQYINPHGHDHDHEHGPVAHDIEDHDDSHEHQQPIPLVEDKPWGQKYSRPRLVCLVPTLWPKKKFVMEV